MKKFLLLQILAIFISGICISQTMTYKFSNPHILYSGGSNHLVFDVMVMGSTSGTYLYSTKIVFNSNNANLNTASNPGFTKGFIAGQYNSQEKYNISTNWGGNTFTVDITPQFTGSNPSAAYSAVTTSWQVIGTVDIIVTTSEATSGINFKTNSITAKYSTATPPYNTSYLIAVDAKDISAMYMSRIYSSGSGWTQIGGTVNWNTSLYTSVWDTGSCAAYVCTTGAKASNLRIHQGGRLKIAAGSDLTCTGSTDILEPRGLIIGSDSGYAQFIDNGTITYGTPETGSVQVHAKFSQDAWHYYTIPLQSTNAQPFLQMYMKYYQEPTNHWKYVWNNNWQYTDTLLITNMQGYALWAASSGAYIHPGHVAPSGKIHTGTITSYPLSRTAAAGYEGWNLVGNPFPSAIDLASSGITWNEITPGGWFWDQTSGNYLVYPPAGDPYGTHDRYAPAQQGFFVHHATTSNTNTTMIIAPSARLINWGTFLKASSESVSDLLFMEVLSVANSKKDKMSIFFRDGSSIGNDEGTDAEKLWGNSDSPQIYSEAGDERYLSVNAVPWHGSDLDVPVGFYCTVPGEYILKATGTETFGNKHIYLLDKKLNHVQELNINPDYTFSFTAGDDNSRFSVMFRQGPLGLGSSPDAEKISLFAYDGSVNVAGYGNTQKPATLSIYDLSGRMVFMHNVEGGNISSFKPGLDHGAYIVILKNENLKVSEKIIL